MLFSLLMGDCPHRKVGKHCCPRSSLCHDDSSRCIRRSSQSTGKCVHGMGAFPKISSQRAGPSRTFTTKSIWTTKDCSKDRSTKPEDVKTQLFCPLEDDGGKRKHEETNGDTDQTKTKPTNKRAIFFSLPRSPVASFLDNTIWHQLRCPKCD